MALEQDLIKFSLNVYKGLQRFINLFILRYYILDTIVIIKIGQCQTRLPRFLAHPL